ncbi:hypothetical protein MNBD_GAMMA09-3373 [hydrothermal vent metagenome]|uniref:PEP-CTERM protein-sorting domain-containing protein n=1 Tax=hydrothermal vent metagenome TaxID=652676 RepID=A0A3B0Y2L0_9ZZZZ
MKKMNLTAAIALSLSAGMMSSSANAALASNAVLNINPGSYFGLDLDGDGQISAQSGTLISQSQGIRVGTAQSITVPPASQPSVIDIWQGSPGTHWTDSPANILSDNGQGTVTLDLSGLNMWDGIQNIFLGSGAWETGFTDGIAQLNCNTDCSFGDSYTLSYFATVPTNDPSDFAGMAYTLQLEGRISAVPVPAAVWLFGSGLLGLAGFLRRRNTTL